MFAKTNVVLMGFNWSFEIHIILYTKTNVTSGHAEPKNIKKNNTIIIGEPTHQGAPRSFCDTTGYSFLSSWNERS